MNRIRREKPLYTMKEICEINGVEYDISQSSDGIKIIINGKVIEFNKNNNLFENINDNLFENIEEI